MNSTHSNLIGRRLSVIWYGDRSDIAKGHNCYIVQWHSGLLLKNACIVCWIFPVQTKRVSHSDCYLSFHPVENENMPWGLGKSASRKAVGNYTSQCRGSGRYLFRMVLSHTCFENVIQLYITAVEAVENHPAIKHMVKMGCLYGYLSPVAS